jgi:hypothetical protein
LEQDSQYHDYVGGFVVCILPANSCMEIGRSCIEWKGQRKGSTLNAYKRVTKAKICRSFGYNLILKFLLQ